MLDEQGRPRPTGGPRAAPIRPGSPLYRLLQLIAREIAGDQMGRSTRDSDTIAEDEPTGDDPRPGTADDVG